MVLMQSIRLCNNGLITSFAVECCPMGKLRVSQIEGTDFSRGWFPTQHIGIGTRRKSLA
jgi:hypothetical protein